MGTLRLHTYLASILFCEQARRPHGAPPVLTCDPLLLGKLSSLTQGLFAPLCTEEAEHASGSILGPQGPDRHLLPRLTSEV